MKMLLPTILVAALVPLGFWLGGYDFDVRGEASLMCYLLSLIFGVYVYYMNRPL